MSPVRLVRLSGPVSVAAASFASFGVGWLLFGIASFRVRVFPAPPKLVVLALAVGWMGFWMWRLDRGSPVEQPSP